MTLDTFIDPGFNRGMIPRAQPQLETTATGRPIITGPLSLANLMRLIPEQGFNWFILQRLWNRREEQVFMWSIINSLADERRDQARSEKRTLRLSISSDLTRLIQSGWVIRHGKKIQLNLIRLSGKTRL